MAQIHFNITLDNIDPSLDANYIANMVESIIKQNSSIDDVKVNIFDNDSSTYGNPILTQNIMKRIR